MKRLVLFSCAVFALLLALAGPASAAKSGGLSLDQYKAKVKAATYRDLLERYDVVAAQDLAGGRVLVDLVLTKSQVQTLRGDGVGVSLRKNAKGLSARQAAAEQAVAGYNVWRDYDSANGMRAYLYDVARRNPQLAKLEVIGHSGQGREILALKLTQSARDVPDGSRPAVLYSALQHAREWIAGEVDRRLVEHYIARWRANDKEIRRLLKDNELWFVLVANPDGYQYTFQSPDTRLWRKTLRDNNGNGTTEVGDGVDPNRNWPEHFNYDREGSSDIFSSDTYRGPVAESEPETTALKGLLDRIDFSFQLNYHSYGRWLLYPEGWQIGTPSGDDPIYYALSGNLFNPAIGDPAHGDGFEPGISSDVLYSTNGETTDYAHVNAGTLAWTPELSESDPGEGFVFDDDEAKIQQEFERNLPFALDVAKSASDPDDPKSHLGLKTKPFYLKSDDTFKTGLPLANFTFDVSYGDPQEVRVLAKRTLGAVTLKYRINGGDVQSKPTTEWNGGDKYGGKTDVYYRVMRGEVTGTSPGESVEVWFEGGGAKSDSFTYQAAVESDNRVLIVANEDYTGASPVQTPGPHYLSYYQDALAGNGIGFDTYDVDARGRKASSALGVLSHYDAVVWYTGDDVITREPGWGGGRASRLAMDQLLNVRDYLNEGGRVLYTGQNAGVQFAAQQRYDPTAQNAQCAAAPAPAPACNTLGGTGDGTNDVLQYWFGAYLLNVGAGVDEAGNVHDVFAVGSPFEPLTLSFNGDDSAQNQTNANSFISTSGILPVETYPQFASEVAAKYDRPGGPFDPHTGESYAYSGIADVSYKRLARTINVPAGGATVSFWTSFDTETAWDHVFVEAHTVGQDNWTTLPDANGHTTQATGESCKRENSGGWHTLHPFLDHYQTQDSDTSCLPTGTTGQWNAASGNSQGWQQWQVDLAAYAGQQVEVVIAYASDWATQGLGVFVDDIEVSTGEGSTSFEGGDTGGWTVPGAPPGSAPNANDFTFTTAAGFPEGAAVRTEDTIYLGFGLEGVTGAGARATVMGRAMGYLLR
jgi:Zinc carboxypeptidase/Immune inhibitor A-like, MAM domain